MEKKPQTPAPTDTTKDISHAKHVDEKPLEKEIDPDNKVHETSPDLIVKESHHLDVDDEHKKG